MGVAKGEASIRLVRTTSLGRSYIQPGSLSITPEAGDRPLVEGLDYAVTLRTGDVEPLRDLGSGLHAAVFQWDDKSEERASAAEAAAAEVSELLQFVDTFEAAAQAGAVPGDLRQQMDLALCQALRRWIPIGLRETGGV